MTNRLWISVTGVSCVLVLSGCPGSSDSGGAAGMTTAGSAGASGKGTGGSAGGAAGKGGSSQAGSGGSSQAGSGGLGGMGGGTAGAGGMATCTDPKEIPGFVDQPLHLVKACSPYHVAQPSTVASGDFTIDAGVTIQFAPGASLEVQDAGTGGKALIASGTAAEPIRFVPDVANAPDGSWTGIGLGAPDGTGNVQLHYVEVHGAGVPGDGVNAPGASVLVRVPSILDHVTIVGSAGYGLTMNVPLASGSNALSFSSIADHLVSLRWDLVPSLPAITAVSGNAKPTIRVAPGDSVSGTWVSQPVPFAVFADQTIGSGQADVPVVLTIAANTLLFDAGIGLGVGATEGQSGTGDLVANGVTFGALDPAKPWSGIAILARYTATTKINGGHITHAHGGNPWSVDVPMTTPTVYDEYYTPLLIGQSSSNLVWATVTGVTIDGISPLPPPMGNDIVLSAGIVVRGIPCGVPAPHYDQMGNTLTASKAVLDYDFCVAPLRKRRTSSTSRHPAITVAGKRPDAGYSNTSAPDASASPDEPSVAPSAVRGRNVAAVVANGQVACRLTNSQHSRAPSVVTSEARTTKATSVETADNVVPGPSRTKSAAAARVGAIDDKNRATPSTRDARARRRSVAPEATSAVRVTSRRRATRA